MDRYTIKFRDKDKNTLILENVDTHELVSVNEGRFKDIYTKVKDAVVKLIETAKGCVMKIGDRIFTDFVHPIDIARNHSKYSGFFSTDESLNDGSYDEYLKKSYNQEVKNLKEYIADLLVFCANVVNREVEMSQQSTNESIATRRPQRYDISRKSSNIWDAIHQIFGDLRDVQKKDKDGNPMFDKDGNPIMIEKTQDEDIFNIMRAACASKNARSSKVSVSEVKPTESEVDSFVEDVYKRFATNGKLENFGAAVDFLAEFIKMRMTAPYKKGANDLSGDDPSAFTWIMLYGIPGIGKSSMMGRIKEMAKEGYFSKSGKTPYAYYSYITGEESVYNDLSLVPISCERADEARFLLPARETGYSTRFLNPKTGKKYTDEEIIERMKDEYGEEWLERRNNFGLGVYYDREKSKEWNDEHATSYRIDEHIASKPSCDIPVIKASDWIEDIDRRIPPTIVFLDEVLMAKPSGLNVIKSMVDKRQIGDYVIASKVIFVGTSNRSEDFGAEQKKAIKDVLSGPTTERALNIHFAPTFTEFIEYGQKINPDTNLPNLHPLLMEFLMMAENRFRFANIFDDNIKGTGERERTVQRGLSHLTRFLYGIISKYEYRIMNGTEEERNRAIDDMLTNIDTVAQATMVGGGDDSDAEVFTDFVRGQYRGVPYDFYKNMWKGNLTKEDMKDSLGNSYSSDYTYTETQEQIKGNKTVPVPIPHHIHISTQTFAERSYKAYPFKKNGAPSSEDLMPDANGKIPIVEYFNNAYRVMYQEKFIVGSDKSYIQKLANYFASNFSNVLFELGMPESLRSNERAKKSYMFGTVLLPGVRDEFDKRGLKFSKPEFYEKVVRESGAVAAIDKTRVIE